MKIIKSPLRYAGNKFSLLPQILELLPENSSRMIDAFGGSGAVCLNMPHSVKIYNESNPHIFRMIRELAITDPAKTLRRVKSIIRKFDLSAKNKEAYLKFRNYSNKRDDYLLFYVLSRYSFSNLTRFNYAGHFTAPFGQRSISDLDNFEYEIVEFHRRMRRTSFTHMHYAKMLSVIRNQLRAGTDFIYFDPPYTASGKITSYDQWSKELDIRLMRNLDRLSKLKIRWMMSNVLTHRHYDNKLLRKWSRNYNVLNVDKAYKFSREAGIKTTKEVLITNY